MVKVLLASAEVVPFAKVGGLADVAGSLPKALAQLDIDIRVIMPKYQTAAEAGADMWRVVPSCPVPMADGMSGCALDESRLPGSEVPIYFVEHHDYFSRPYVYGPPGGAYPDNLERLTFFCRAILAVLEPLNWQPDVIHLNDWHTSLVAVYLKQPEVCGPRTVFTAHNLGSAYQGTFPAEMLEVTGLENGDPGVTDMLHQGQLNLARTGLACADMVNTVSEKYAQEIETPESGPNICDLVEARRKDVWGILNGIDYEVWNPATDEALAANFSADDVSGKAQCKQALQEQMGLPVASNIPLIGMVTRLDAQKGLDILDEALPHIQNAQLVVLGTGDQRYENMLREASAAQENVAAVIDFSGELARQIYAGADMFLMPSRYEPCGLGQMIALAYGTVPIVRATGGLDDSIQERGVRGSPQNGYKFEGYSAEELLDTINRAVDTFTSPRGRWRKIVNNALNCDFSWDRSAKKYLELYQAAIDKTA